MVDFSLNKGPSINNPQAFQEFSQPQGIGEMCHNLYIYMQNEVFVLQVTQLTIP